MFDKTEAAKIAHAMSGTIDPRYNEATWTLIFHCPNGFKWQIQDGKNPKMWNISLCKPEIDRKAYTGQVDTAWKQQITEINSAKSKSIDQIVADIKRRFDFESLTVIHNAYRKCETDYKNLISKHEQICARLESLGLKADRRRSEDTLEFGIPRNKYPEIYGEVLVSGESVDFRIRYVKDADLVDSIVKLLKGSN